MAFTCFTQLVFHLVLLAFCLPLVGSQAVEVAIRKCIPGAPCTAYISSATYTMDVPHLMVVREDHPCGSPPDAQFLANNPASGTVAVENTSLFNFGVAGPSPGLYRLCLCATNCLMSSQIANPLAFTEDVGDLLVSGPLEAKQMPAVCVAGAGSCTVNVTAIGAHPGSAGFAGGTKTIIGFDVAVAITVRFDFC